MEARQGHGHRRCRGARMARPSADFARRGTARKDRQRPAQSDSRPTRRRGSRLSTPTRIGAESVTTPTAYADPAKGFFLSPRSGLRMRRDRGGTLAPQIAEEAAAARIRSSFTVRGRVCAVRFGARKLSGAQTGTHAEIMRAKRSVLHRIFRSKMTLLDRDVPGLSRQ